MIANLLGIALIICVALCGWAIAEMKTKHCVYEHSQEESEVEQQANEQILKNGFNELGINDVIATISTKGFNA